MQPIRQKLVKNRTAGFALIFALVVVFLLAAAGVTLFQASKKKHKHSSLSKAKEFASHLSDGALNRGYLDLAQFIFGDNGMESDPGPTVDDLNGGNLIGYLINHRPDDQLRYPGEQDYTGPDLGHWQVQKDGNDTPLYLWTEKYFDPQDTTQAGDGSSYTALIAPYRVAKEIDDEDGDGINEITFIYQFAIRSQGNAADRVSFNPESYAKDHHLSAIHAEVFQPITNPDLQAKGERTKVELKQQLLPGGVESILYGALEISYAVDPMQIQVYITDEVGKLVILDISDLNEIGIDDRLAIAPHGCKLWVDQFNHRYVGISHCSRDIEGDPVSEEPSFTIVDLLGNANEPSVKQNYSGLLMHDMAFYQQDNNPNGYGIDREGKLWNMNQEHGTLAPMETLDANGQTVDFNICEHMADLNDTGVSQCKAGLGREYDMPVGYSQMFNKIVLREGNQAFVSLPGIGRLAVVDLDAKQITANITMPGWDPNVSRQIPGWLRVRYDDLSFSMFDGFHVPMDNPDWFISAFLSDIQVDYHESDSSELSRYFYDLPNVDPARTHSETIAAPIGARAIPWIKTGSDYSLTEEPFIFYPSFQVENIASGGDSPLYASSMNLWQANLDPNQPEAEMYRTIYPSPIENLPVQMMFSQMSCCGYRGDRDRDRCPAGIPLCASGEEPEEIYRPISTAATKTGYALNGHAAMAMTQIGSVAILPLPSADNSNPVPRLVQLAPQAEYPNIYSGVAPRQYQPVFVLITPNNQFLAITRPGQDTGITGDTSWKGKVYLGPMERPDEICDIIDPDNCGTEITTWSAEDLLNAEPAVSSDIGSFMAPGDAVWAPPPTNPSS